MRCFNFRSCLSIISNDSETHIIHTRAATQLRTTKIASESVTSESRERDNRVLTSLSPVVVERQVLIIQQSVSEIQLNRHYKVSRRTGKRPSLKFPDCVLPPSREASLKGGPLNSHKRARNYPPLNTPRVQHRDGTLLLLRAALSISSPFPVHVAELPSPLYSSPIRLYFHVPFSRHNSPPLKVKYSARNFRLPPGVFLIIDTNSHQLGMYK